MRSLRGALGVWLFAMAIGGLFGCRRCSVTIGGRPPLAVAPSAPVAPVPAAPTATPTPTPVVTPVTTPKLPAARPAQSMPRQPLQELEKRSVPVR